MQNRALTQWKSGTPSLGAWVSVGEVHGAEVIARMGFDWLCFDLQHGTLAVADLRHLLPAVASAEATPLVRVTQNDAAEIGRALDLGAHGVIVPMVSTPEQAARAVTACRYPPLGARSYGPIRGAMLEGDAYRATANAEVACIVMIETGEGLKNVEAIAATPGVDALFVGPMDLCFGLSVTPGAFSDPAFVAALTRIKAAARAAGCAVGIFGYTPQAARDAFAEGFHFASIGTDIGFLREGAKAALATVRGVPASASAKGY